MSASISKQLPRMSLSKRRRPIFYSFLFFSAFTFFLFFFFVSFPRVTPTFPASCFYRDAIFTAILLNCRLKSAPSNNRIDTASVVSSGNPLAANFRKRQPRGKPAYPLRIHSVAQYSLQTSGLSGNSITVKNPTEIRQVLSSSSLSSSSRANKSRQLLRGIKLEGERARSPRSIQISLHGNAIGS